MADHPGIVQHAGYLAYDGSLADRLAATAGPNPPPERRYRLLLDLGADDLDELRYQLDQVQAAIDAGSVKSTSGGPAHGYHYELLKRDVDHDRFHEDLRTWSETLRG